MLNNNNIAVKTVGLSKIYKLYNKPFDRVRELFSAKGYHKDFSALSNISFEVTKGSTLGIIGDNGAGKSTLLKILANTLTPSSGTMEITGRVGSLLELGAGFHPELSGRQNYYLHAAILGLSETEIKEKENAILDFAEIGDFIDQPVKTYSSGMNLRLGFSIATSINPDVLIVDEALSVGDEYFQKKSIDRMINFKNSGKTIVFCSHSMYQINLLCERAIWIKEGQLHKIGPSADVTAAYENYQRKKSGKINNKQLKEETDVSTKWIRFIKLNDSVKPIKLQHKQKLFTEIEFVSIDNEPYTIAIGIQRTDGIIAHAINLKNEKKLLFNKKGINRLRINYSKLPLLHGEFVLFVYILDENGVYVYHYTQSQTFTVKTHQKTKYEIGLMSMDFSIELM